ncbi:MAG: hypothetical protein AAGF92_04060 [Myxococcota bacterium]
MKTYHRGTIVGTLIGGLFGLVLAAGAVAFAAPGEGHGKRWSPEKMAQHMNEIISELDLSAAQEAQMRTIMTDARAQMEAIEEMPRSQAKFEAFREVLFTTDDQIHANLSCEQREQLRLLKREHKAERMKERFEKRQAEQSE